jgi:hypothetical protein
MNFPGFPTSSNLMRTLLILAALTLNLAAATPLCKIVEGWTRLNERLHQEGVTLGQNLAAKLDGNPSITAHARFQNHPNGPRLAAQEEIDGALGAAEEARAGLIGDQGAGEFIEVATTSRVVSSSVTYEEMGRGFGQMGASAADAGITNVDEYMALVFQKQRIKFQTNPQMLASNYTEASYLKDWNRLFDDGGNLHVAKELHVGLSTGGNEGLIGNIHSAAVMKSRGVTIEIIDPDQVDDTFQKIDILTPDSMIQTALRSETVRAKIGYSISEAEDVADLIIQMESTHPGRLYKFSYMDGNPEDFDLAISYLNANFTNKNHPRVFSRNDFIKTGWNE